MRRALLLPLLFILAACAGHPDDKYPYPPQFVQVDDICPCELGAPPEKGSAIYQKEIAGIIATQAKLTDAQKAAIMEEDHIRPAMIVTPVLGAQYSEASNPALFALLGHAASDAWRIADSAQEFWGRTRPWLTDSRVQILVSKITRPSYPSGHSTTNHIWAYVLSDLIPAKREALFKRAHEIGMHRVAAGVHYPSDIEAGKRIAGMIYARMKANPQFQQELAAARAELAAPKPANDNVPHGTAANCSTSHADMVMCK